MNEYTGITKNNGTFKVQLARKGHVFYLGNFPTAVQAAQTYDRATLLTAAWSNRRIVLNFQDSKKPSDESTFTDFEKQMLTYLRTYFPEAERDARNREAVNQETPDVLLKDYSNLRERVIATNDLLLQTLAESESTIAFMAAKMADLKERNEFYMKQVAELNLTITKLRGIRTEDGKPKFKFTPVVRDAPPPEQITYRPDLNPANKATVSETPPSAAPTVFPEAAVLPQVVEDREVKSSGVTEPGIELGSVEDQGRSGDPEDDEQPIYPQSPAAPNSLDELASNPTFGRE